jgi:glycosyltransferase involved in cell wall biosynthesis
MTEFPAPALQEELAQPPKKVLLIAFDFPPRRTSGVYRPSAFAKYLPQCGWRPTVLTVKGREGETTDSTLVGRIPPQLEVARTPYVRVDAWEHSTAKALRATGTLRVARSDSRQSLKDKAVRTLGHWLRAFLYFPDRAVGWIPFGLLGAIRLHRKQRFDVIYTSSNPFSAAVIGLLLKVLFNVPWVVEFRDPWLLPLNLRASLGDAAPLPRRLLERALYALVLRRADLVIAVTEGHAEELRMVDRVPPRKIAVVTNGFDEDDFKNPAISESGLLGAGYLHLTHFGDIYPRFSGQFFPALAELARECPELQQSLRVNIVGFPDEVTRRYASSGELAEIVQLHGFVPHGEALQTMRSTDWLLLFYGDPHISRLCIPGKLYEYLRIGRPILAVAYDGGAKQLIEQGKAGWVDPPDNIESIKQTIRKVVMGSRKNGSSGPPRPEFVAQFQYKRVASNLAGILEGVARNGR